MLQVCDMGPTALLPLRRKYTSLIMSHQILLRMRNISDKSCRENQHTHLVFNTPTPTPLKRNNAVCEIMWKKYCRARQATDDNMVHVHCMLDT